MENKKFNLLGSKQKATNRVRAHVLFVVVFYLQDDTHFETLGRCALKSSLAQSINFRNSVSFITHFTECVKQTTINNLTSGAIDRSRTENVSFRKHSKSRSSGYYNVICSIEVLEPFTANVVFFRSNDLFTSRRKVPSP